MAQDLDSLIARVVAGRANTAVLKDLADVSPQTLTPHLKQLLGAGLVRPPELYRAADSDVQRELVAKIEAAHEEDNLDHLLKALARTRGPVAEEAFRRWERQPPTGMRQCTVHLSPSTRQVDAFGDTSRLPLVRMRPGDRTCSYGVGSGLGGHPEWEGDASYPTCPACATEMPFIAQIYRADLLDDDLWNLDEDDDVDDVTDGHFMFFLHTECRIVAMLFSGRLEQ